ncbi:hypothetical protein B0H17DRAFT_1163280 [Mycena rosella]|uniref:DNA-directed RNA polymerase n=1 Tax=Mycena rosella TaxID=1033263 RepID=A0AAD7CQC4_MYCRO|nr:hypothetical protein B0H17DRAFT_1163280 [Mycena rosella]
MGQGPQNVIMILECPGHFAHIELARPVFHPGFIFKVKKILERICINCRKLEVDIIRRIRDPKNRVWAHCRTRLVCELNREGRKEGHAGCGYVQRHIRKRGPSALCGIREAKADEMMESTQPETYEETRLLSPSDVYTTFKKISNPDLDLSNIVLGNVS